MASMKIDSEEIRRLIRDAMQRLLEGKPIRSDGKLTVKSLAAEAGIKRWILTHQHRDLQKEFRDRCANQDAVPDALRELTEDIEKLKAEVCKFKDRIRDLTEEAHRYTRIIQVLTLENLQLREDLGKRNDNVRHLR